MGVRFEVVKRQGQEVVLEIHKVVIHRFLVSDVDDPDLYASQPMWDWQNSEAGQFVMKHSMSQPEWHRNISHATITYEYAIVAELEKKKLSEFYLRFGRSNIK